MELSLRAHQNEMLNLCYAARPEFVLEAVRKHVTYCKWSNGNHPVGIEGARMREFDRRSLCMDLMQKCDVSTKDLTRTCPMLIPELSSEL